MAVPRDTVWPRDRHTAEKHALIHRYMDAWWPIMLRRFPGATYAEGFAGPGEYSQGEDGSPIEAMAALLRRDRPIVTDRPARFVFVEERADRVAHLRSVITDRFPALPPFVEVAVHQGACAQRLLDALGEAGAWGQPIFVNLDPFNVEVSYDMVRRIGANRSSEVLVTFMSDWLTRWAKDESQEQGDLLFGDRAWRKVTEQPIAGKKRFLVDLYKQRLREAGFAFQLTFELVDEGGRAFFLVHATSSLKGVEKMKDAMWDRDRVHGVRFRDPRDRNQVAFDIRHRPDLGGLVGPLADRLADRAWTAIEILRAWALAETPFKATHENSLLRRWLAEGRLATRGGTTIQAGTQVALHDPPPSPTPPAPPAAQPDTPPVDEQPRLFEF